MSTHALNRIDGTDWLSAVVSSIIRLAETRVLYINIDRTWNLGKIGIWA